MGQEPSKGYSSNRKITDHFNVEEIKQTEIKKPMYSSKPNHKPYSFGKRGREMGKSLQEKRTKTNLLGLHMTNSSFLYSTHFSNNRSELQDSSKLQENGQSFFDSFLFKPRLLILEYLLEDIPVIMKVSKKWRKEIKSLIQLNANKALKRFNSKNSEFLKESSLNIRYYEDNKLNRLDLLFNFKLKPGFQSSNVSLFYKYKLLSKAETLKSNFEFNITAKTPNTFCIVYEHSRLKGTDPFLWSPHPKTLPIGSTITIPLILYSKDEYVDLSTVRWSKFIFKEEKSFNEKIICSQLSNFEWKTVKNKIVDNLLPTPLLQNYFKLVDKSFKGLDKIIVKAIYKANKKANIKICDKNNERNSLRINVFRKEELVNSKNILRPVNVIKDIKEAINICEMDFLIFYIKKDLCVEEK